MKKISILSAAAVAVLASPAMAAPGSSDTAAGAATAEIVAPITLTHTTGAALDFGTFTTGTTGGTVVVDQAGAGTAFGDVTLVTGSVEAADQFTVAGDPSRTFSIAATNGSVSNGLATPTLMGFTTDVAASGALDGSGAASFSVGGTLTVAGGEPAGTYTGSYDVTVAYN